MGKSFAWRDGDRIVFLGDSLTRRTGVLLSGDPAARLSLYMGSWVEEVELLVTSSQPGLRIQYWNAGVGGDTVLHLRQRVEQDVLSLDPTRVVIGNTTDGLHLSRVGNAALATAVLGCLGFDLL